MHDINGYKYKLWIDLLNHEFIWQITFEVPHIKMRLCRSRFFCIEFYLRELNLEISLKINNVFESLWIRHMNEIIVKWFLSPGLKYI